MAFSWILTYGTALQQVAALVVHQRVRDKYKVRTGLAEGVEQAHRCSPSLRTSISCSSSLASPVSVVLSLALITSSAH
jgi:hypothetical protein